MILTLQQSALSYLITESFFVIDIFWIDCSFFIFNQFWRTYLSSTIIKVNIMKDEITVFQIYNNEKHINNIFCFSTNCKQKRYSSTYIFLCSSISFEELNTNLIRLTKYELNDSFLKCEEIPSGYSSGDRFFTLNLTL